MISKKHLILFSYDFPPSNGGIARLCQEIAVGMSSYFQKITVLTRDKSGENIPYNNGVRIKVLPKKRVLCELAAFKYLSNMENKSNCILLCGIWHPEALIAFASGFRNIFILGHGTEFLSGGSFLRKGLWLGIYARYILQRSSLIICNSAYTNRLVNNITQDSISVTLPLAVNHRHFTPRKKLVSNHKLNICTVSRIEKFKGHDFIARVLAKFPKEILANINWNIAGIGPDYQYVKTIIDNAQLNHVVNFFGFVPDTQLPSFYRSNDLFILCSREEPNTISVEGFGLVFLEAQACGVPVIGTKTGGISDAVIQDESGWLIEQDNEEELYDLIYRLFSDRNKITDMGFKARTRIENEATWENYCSKLFSYLGKND